MKKQEYLLMKSQWTTTLRRRTLGINRLSSPSKRSVKANGNAVGLPLKYSQVRSINVPIRFIRPN